MNKNSTFTNTKIGPGWGLKLNLVSVYEINSKIPKDPSTYSFSIKRHFMKPFFPFKTVSVNYVSKKLLRKRDSNDFIEFK
jgi:hypothetical protein